MRSRTWRRESDGEHVTVVWNSDDNQINVIDGEGNIIAVNRRVVEASKT